MNYEALECELHPGEWVVEAFDMDGDGDCYMARFSGPQSEQRAREYAEWKNQ